MNKIKKLTCITGCILGSCKIQITRNASRRMWVEGPRIQIELTPQRNSTQASWNPILNPQTTSTHLKRSYILKLRLRVVKRMQFRTTAHIKKNTSVHSHTICDHVLRVKIETRDRSYVLNLSISRQALINVWMWGRTLPKIHLTKMKTICFTVSFKMNHWKKTKQKTFFHSYF